MAEDIPEKKQKQRKGLPQWMTTYADMVTLLLCFFVLLINPPVVEAERLQLIMASLNNMGVLQGGNTLESGPLAELGNTVYGPAICNAAAPPRRSAAKSGQRL